MNDDDIEINAETIGSLVPIGSLSKEGMQEAINGMTLERLHSGRILFRRGDTDEDTVYLLSGTVQLTAADQQTRSVTGGEDAAQYALANLKPRRYTAKATTDIVVARMNSTLLDELIGWDQVVKNQGESYEVRDLGRAEEGADLSDTAWMMMLMRYNVFRNLPTANLHMLFNCIERAAVKGGDIIIRQGDEGDFYYILLEGRALVSRKDSEDWKTVTLATLKEGDSFGEEALLSGQPRNATVSMLTDGELLRLAKADFVRLLQEPLVKRVSPKEAAAMVKSGASMVDVRLEREYQHSALKDSINIPLYLLRLRLSKLDSKRPYILYCDNEKRSMAAAFVMSEHGLKTFVLDGGLIKYKRGHD